jgi:predicted phage tail protein
MSDISQVHDEPQSAASKLFDIRLLIGGLFVLYGALLTVSGFFTSGKEKAKAAGININLWLGLGMLLLGALFLLWRHLNPQHVERPDDDAETTEGAGHGH